MNYIKENIASNILLILLINVLLLNQGNAQPSVNLTSSNLPIVVINTHGEEIKDSPKITADMGIIDNGEGIRNNITDPFNGYNGKIVIEIRGSSSQMFDKKQYGFETCDSAGEDMDVSLLGMPKESDWILSAPYADKTLMRDALAYYISNSMGRYASRSRFCEVLINNQYVGVYILLEKIKRSKNRVNIAKLTSGDTTGNKLSGGYIIKIDKIDGDKTYGWISSYKPYPGSRQTTLYQYHYPDQDDILPVQKEYIQSYIKSFEDLMNSDEYADSMNGYSKLISVKSFVDYFIINELSKNVDGYRLSAFMHKDRDSSSGQLKAGPVWDYNFAFGNVNYHDSFLTEGWHLEYISTNNNFRNVDDYLPPFYWKKLFDDPSFMDKAARRWKELRGDILSLENVNGVIDSLVTLLDESQERNFTKWDIIKWPPVWPTMYVGNTYADEINYLKTWIQQRFTWIDSELEKHILVDVNEDKQIPQQFLLSQNYPNPFNAGTVFKYQLPFSGNVKLSIYDVLGKEVTVIENGFKTGGSHEIVFNAGKLSSGVYFYKLQFGGTQYSKQINLSDFKKFILLK